MIAEPATDKANAKAEYETTFRRLHDEPKWHNGERTNLADLAWERFMEHLDFDADDLMKAAESPEAALAFVQHMALDWRDYVDGAYRMLMEETR